MADLKMDDYLNLILWAVGSFIAIGILMALMRRRRDELVEQLSTYVEQQTAVEPEPTDDKSE